ncbi:hypothetical protein P280DRAFT_333440 [Massarina eburnea CBS 473.64]|uniref:Uncharacterized protein n=1 Tax=Massarina eburnea CBS 473.64 TaxID=1395130 RepID=A0A6A6RZE1_9PLEO|nr:hypothetical protein P280DRAFT_333440 [Massarina eburnea CBS 473.64]
MGGEELHKILVVKQGVRPVRAPTSGIMPQNVVVTQDIPSPAEAIGLVMACRIATVPFHALGALGALEHDSRGWRIAASHDRAGRILEHGIDEPATVHVKMGWDDNGDPPDRVHPPGRHGGTRGDVARHGPKSRPVERQQADSSRGSELKRRIRYMYGSYRRCVARGGS